MSDIETEKFRQIGIDLINEYRQQRGIRLLDWLVIDTPETSAFIRSIQLHEKTKQELADCKQELADFKQKVSDVASVCAQHFCENSWTVGDRQDHVDMLSRLIIPAPKPDPLVAACNALNWDFSVAEELRTILDALGFEIKEKNDV
jgi:hypothetical protein